MDGSDIGQRPTEVVPAGLTHPLLYKFSLSVDAHQVVMLWSQEMQLGCYGPPVARN